ncbi:MAG: hypothetical protein DHS20C09_13710 [marine bacterium B5-7]|nr:MAG: hypothetical protein DHS20C09_13710 [marine bacterium B5-7]
MSELGPIKPVSQPIAVKPIKKDPGNKENDKKKEKDKHDSGVTKPEGHVDEYI